MTVAPTPPYFDTSAGAWIFSRYADVAEALRDSRLQPAGATSGPPKASRGQAHLEMREAVSRELTLADLSRWQQVLEARARELLSGLSANSVVDLLEEYGRPWCLTAAVIVTGADPKDVQRLSELARVASASAADPGDSSSRAKAKAASEQLRGFFPPGPSSLRGPGFVALSQTLLSLLGNVWVALCEHPEQYARLHRIPDLLARAIDELLRYAGVPQTLYRLAEHDLSLCGVQIEAGQRVILKLSSAHRDPSAYPNPERLDLDQRGPAPLCLGMGEHSCVGAGLIRMAVAVATQALTQTFRSIELVEDLDWEGGEGFCTPKSLRVLATR